MNNATELVDSEFGKDLIHAVRILWLEYSFGNPMHTKTILVGIAYISRLESVAAEIKPEKISILQFLYTESVRNLTDLLGSFAMPQPS